MLIEQAIKLQENINEFKSLKEQAKNAALFSSRFEKLQKPLNNVKTQRGLLSLIKTFKIFTNHNIEINFDISYSKALLEKVIKLKEDYYKDNSSIIKVTDEYSIWTPLEKLPKKLEEALKTSWKKFLEEKRPDVKIKTLEAFEKISGLNTQIKEIRENLKNYDNLYNFLPEVESDFYFFEESLKKINEGLKNFQEKDFPPYILKFIRAAGEGGLNLGNINFEEFKEIFYWLKENKLENLFKIVSR